MSIELLKKLEGKLNVDLGEYWWKQYIASAFWSNISTPLNLSITILTALTTGQATTNNLLNHSTYVGINIASLILSVLNTFFKPYSQVSENVKIMNEFGVFGNRYEKIVYTPYATDDDVKRRIDELRQLTNDINTYKTALSPEVRNFITDLIYMIAKSTCLRKDIKWLDDIDMP
jgi:hypothetical protein